MWSLQRQRGMTLIGWAFTLALFGCVVYVGLKVVPIYLTAYDVESVLKTLKSEPGIANASPEQIRDHLGKMLDVNDIDHPTARQARISGSPGDRTVELKYEVRTKLSSNVGMVFTFNPSVQLRGPNS